MALRRMALASALAALAVLACAASALAHAPAVKLAEAEFNGPPAVSVTATGTAFIAWADEFKTPYTIKYCVLPVDAAGCAITGTLSPAGGAGATIDKVQVLEDGGTIVVLADVYGVSEADIPLQEWISTDGGNTFTTVNGGKSVGEGILDADTRPLDAMLVPGTSALGFAWNTAEGPPTFAEFPFGSTSECSVKKTLTCPFATLQPPAAENQLGNLEGSVASELGSEPGVLGVYETLGKPGCASGTFDTAFAYGSGLQSASNDYNKSPGEAGSAWNVGLSPGDCEVEYPAVGGGPSGLGVLEANEAAHGELYHRFDSAHHSFDTTFATVGGEGGIDPSVTQDAAGGVYATYLAGLDEVQLAYSYDGGTTWSGPTTLDAGSVNDLTSTVSPEGLGWAVWREGESVYAQSFVAADAVAPPAPTALTTSQTDGAASGTSIAIAPGTVGETDKATISGVNASSAQGSVAYTLYSSSTCAASSKVLTSVVGVSGGVAPASAPVTTALAPGQYYWQASYSGNSGNDLGLKGNAPSTSVCGSEVLTIAAPVSGYTIKSIVSNSDGTVTITLVPIEAGKATLVLTVPTASIASASARDAKAKKCKHGQVKLKGKCRPASTVVGQTSGSGTAGVPLKLVVHLSSKIKAQLEHGKTVHLIATLTYTSAFGGKATVHTYHLTIKGHRAKKKK